MIPTLTLSQIVEFKVQDNATLNGMEVSAAGILEFTLNKALSVEVGVLIAEVEILRFGADGKLTLLLIFLHGKLTLTGDDTDNGP